MRIDAFAAALLFLTTSALSAQNPSAAIGAADVEKMRALFTAALAEPHGKAEKDLLAAVKLFETKYSIASVEKALRMGPLIPKGAPKPRKIGKQSEKLETFGDVVTGFTFTSGGATYRYLVDVPKSYDGSKPFMLLVDPGHGTGKSKSQKEKADFTPFYRNQAANAGLDDVLVARTEIVEQIGAEGLAGAKPEDEVADVFRAFYRDVASRFAIDPDKIVVAGLSQTGFWAWYLGQSRADRYRGIAPMSAVTWQSTKYVDNFRALKVEILHGDDDKICPVAQARAMKKLFDERGFSADYDEVAGAGHEVRVWARLGDALKKIAEHPRERYPLHVSKKMQTLAEPWCYWLKVDAIEKSGDGKAGGLPTASIEGEIDGAEIRVKSEGVAKFTLFLAAEMIDIEKPIEVLWNGKSVFRGSAKPSVARAVETALEKADWSATYRAALEFKK